MMCGFFIPPTPHLRGEQAAGGTSLGLEMGPIAAPWLRGRRPPARSAAQPRFSAEELRGGNWLAEGGMKGRGRGATAKEGPGRSGASRRADEAARLGFHWSPARSFSRRSLHGSPTQSDFSFCPGEQASSGGGLSSSRDCLAD